MDFWNTYEKEGKKELQISGSGIIFELKLRGVFIRGKEII